MKYFGLFVLVALLWLPASVNAKQVISFTASLSAGYEFASPVGYSPPFFLPYAGQAHNLICGFNSSWAYGPWKMTMQQNGVDTPLSCTVTDQAPTCTDNHYVGFSAGQHMRVKLEFVGQGPGAGIIACGYEFD
jgi:hypothetical protein